MGVLNFVAITAATDVIEWDTSGSATASKPYLSINESTDVVYWKTSGFFEKTLGLDQDTDILEWKG